MNTPVAEISLPAAPPSVDDLPEPVTSPPARPAAAGRRRLRRVRKADPAPPPEAVPVSYLVPDPRTPGEWWLLRRPGRPGTVLDVLSASLLGATPGTKAAPAPPAEPAPAPAASPGPPPAAAPAGSPGPPGSAPAAAAPAAPASGHHQPAAAAPPDIQFCPTLAAAAELLEPEEEFVLALPLEMGLFQRLTLPKSPPDELRDMTRLQFEKVLPFAGDEIEVEHQLAGPDRPEEEGEGGEVPVLAQAILVERLVATCQPLTDAGRWPQQVTFACLLRAAAASEAPVPEEVAALQVCPRSLVLYREGGRFVLGLVDQGRLSYVHALGTDLSPDRLETELSPLLLSAELEGVSTDCAVLWLDVDEPGWREALEHSMLRRGLLAAVETLPLLPPPSVAVPANFSPASWRAERQRRHRQRQTQRYLFIGLAVYVLACLLAAADIGLLRMRIGPLDRQIAAAAPRLDQVAASQQRWQGLGPALDPRQSTVELLDQVLQCLPQGDLRVTLFDLSRVRSPAVLTIEGEAPSFEQAIELGERLKARPQLRFFRFTSEPPSILPNGRARFRFTGKATTSS